MTDEASTLNLRTLRQRADLPQHQLATLLGVDQSQISRWETSPETIPVTTLVALSKVLGMTVDQLLTGVEIESELSPHVDPSLRQRLERFAESLTSVGDSSPELAARAAAGRLQGPAEVDRAVAGHLRKPRVMVVGPFDGGKSTFVNTLLNSRTLPVRYQPTTALITLVKHVDDRPGWMRNPMTDWLADNIGRQNPPEVLILRDGFDLQQLDDEDHVCRHYLTAGGLDLLTQVGAHGQEPGLPDASTAVCFLDADILKVCDLVDTPGNDASEDDDRRAQAATTAADVLVQLSPVTGFMATHQIAYLLPAIRSLPPMLDTPAVTRVFIVASHAHAGITDAQLTDLLDDGAARLAAAMHADPSPRADSSGEDTQPLTLAALGWDTPQAVRARLFSFYDSNGHGASRGEPLLTELMTLLGQTLPQVNVAHLPDSLTATVHSYAAENQKQSASLAAAESASAELPDAEREAQQIEEAVDKSRTNLAGAVEQHRTQCSQALHDTVNDHVNAESIELLIRSTYSAEAFTKAGRKGKDHKKAAQQEVGPLVVSQLQDRLATILRDESATFAETLDAELDALSDDIDKIDHASNTGDIPFDLRGAFVGAALSTVAVGALAAWASTLGNLGAYIIAAQAAGWLSAVGISLPAGGATLTTAMAAVGGPVGIAVAIIVVGVLVGLMFRTDWEERLAKAVVKGFNKPDKRTGRTIRQELQHAVTRYWDDTQHSVEVGLDNVVQNHRDKLQRFRDLIGDDIDSVTKREERRQLLNDLQQYFHELLTIITISRRTL